MRSHGPAALDFLATIHAKEHLPGGAGAFRAADRPRRHRLVPLAGARNSRAPFPGKVVMAAELGILWALMFGVPASLLGEIRRRGPVHRPSHGGGGAKTARSASAALVARVTPAAAFVLPLF